MRVLVVEDEYFIANEICAALRLCGANVLGPAPDNERALELVGTTAVDCAVLDINLHGQRDFALAEEFRRRGVPTIFATGYDETIVPGSLAMTKRLEKPVDLRTLLRSVKSAVRGG